MRYNAFFGELPINAFKPIGGRMTLHGGGNPLSIVTDAIEGVGDIVGDVVEGVDDVYMDVRDPLVAAAVIAGNYYLPGSSLITSQLVNDGAQEILNSDTGRLANLAAGATGGYQGNLSNYGEIGEAAGLTGSGDAVANSGAVASPVTQGSVVGTPLGELGAVTSPVSAGAVTGTSLGQLGAAEAASGGEALSGIDLGGVGGSPNSMTLGGGYSAVPAALSSVTPAASSGLSAMLPYMAGGQAVTGLLQADAAKKAANIQSAAARDATALQGEMFNTINQQQAPYRTAGYGALNQIGGLGGGEYTTYDASGNPTGTAQGSGYLTHQFDATDLQKGLAPNYDFMLQQGQMANQRAANMGGGALGGNALQGLNKYTQDYAGNAYQNAFTNYQNQRSNIYNTLAGIAGIGQAGQTATNAAGTNATNAATQLGIGSASAQAAGQVGSANALSNTVGNIGNTYMLSQLLNQSGRVG